MPGRRAAGARPISRVHAQGAAGAALTVLEALCVLATIVAWGSGLYAVFTHKVTRDFVLGRWHRKHRKEFFLPVVGVIWSAATLAALITWRYVQVNRARRRRPRALVPHLTGSLQGPAGTTEVAHTYFRVGWSQTLILFGIRIETFWKYAVIACYQFGRGVIGSLLDTVYSPLVAEAQSSANPLYAQDADTDVVRYRRDILAGQTLAKILSWWSSVTDIMMAMTQLDLALFPVVASATTAAIISSWRIDGAINGARAALWTKPTLLI